MDRYVLRLFAACFVLAIITACYGRKSEEIHEVANDESVGKQELHPGSSEEEEGLELAISDLSADQLARCFNGLPNGYVFADAAGYPVYAGGGESQADFLQKTVQGVGKQGAVFRVVPIDGRGPMIALKVFYKADQPYLGADKMGAMVKEDLAVARALAPVQLDRSGNPIITAFHAQGANGQEVVLKSIVQGPTLRELIGNDEFLFNAELGEGDKNKLAKFAERLYELTAPQDVKGRVLYASFADLNHGNWVWQEGVEGGRWVVVDCKEPVWHTSRAAAMKAIFKPDVAKVDVRLNNGFQGLTAFPDLVQKYARQGLVQKMLRNSSSSGELETRAAGSSVPSHTPEQFGHMRDFLGELEVATVTFAELEDLQRGVVDVDVDRRMSAPPEETTIKKTMKRIMTPRGSVDMEEAVKAYKAKEAHVAKKLDRRFLYLPESFWRIRLR